MNCFPCQTASCPSELLTAEVTPSLRILAASGGATTVGVGAGEAVGTIGFGVFAVGAVDTGASDVDALRQPDGGSDVAVAAATAVGSGTTIVRSTAATSCATRHEKNASAPPTSRTRPKTPTIPHRSQRIIAPRLSLSELF